MLKNSLLKLPDTPGAYIFFEGEIPIYIGKAINLKRRVSSYFDLDLAPKTAKMVSSANSLSYIRVESELESLLLEAKLIRKYMPKYNVISKDDKHPLYIGITKEKFPRVLSVRKLMANNYSLYASYGPFPSSKNVRSFLRMLRKIFPYSDHKISKRPCLYSHIGLCNPCPNTITNSQLPIYKSNIKNIKQILNGNVKKLKTDLIRKMQNYSNEQKFEESALIRDQIQKLEYITKPQMPTDFYIQNPNLYEDQRKLEIEALRKLIENCKTSWPSAVKIENLQRIECFDIAHLAGTNPTASMVVFINGEAEKSEYRHFKIRQTKGQSDYDSMREIASRRARHFSDWGKPNLIIVDGGKGQVSSFVINVPIVGIAKNPDRLIIGEEKIKLTGNALNLVQRMRDEAHRFARRYHHHLISKEYRNANHT